MAKALSKQQIEDFIRTCPVNIKEEFIKYDFKTIKHILSLMKEIYVKDYEIINKIVLKEVNILDIIDIKYINIMANRCYPEGYPDGWEREHHLKYGCGPYFFVNTTLYPICEKVENNTLEENLAIIIGNILSNNDKNNDFWINYNKQKEELKIEDDIWKFNRNINLSLKLKSRDNIIEEISIKTKTNIDEIKKEYSKQVEDIYVCKLHEYIRNYINHEICVLLENKKPMYPEIANYKRFWAKSRGFILEGNNINLYLCKEHTHKQYNIDKELYLKDKIVENCEGENYNRWGRTTKGNGVFSIETHYKEVVIIISELIKLKNISVNNDGKEYNLNIHELSIEDFNEKFGKYSKNEEEEQDEVVIEETIEEYSESEDTEYKQEYIKPIFNFTKIIVLSLVLFIILKCC